MTGIALLWIEKAPIVTHDIQLEGFPGRRHPLIEPRLVDLGRREVGLDEVEGARGRIRWEDVSPPLELEGPRVAVRPLRLGEHDELIVARTEGDGQAREVVGVLVSGHVESFDERRAG